MIRVQRVQHSLPALPARRLLLNSAPRRLRSFSHPLRASRSNPITPHQVITLDWLQAGLTQARSIKPTSTLLVQADPVALLTRQVNALRKEEKIIWVQMGDRKVPRRLIKPQDKIMEIPLMSERTETQARFSFSLAAFNGWIEYGESIVVLSGGFGSGLLNGAFLFNTTFPDFAGLPKPKDLPEMTEQKRTILHILLTFASRLAMHGKEGSAVGATFILGRPDDIKPFTSSIESTELTFSKTPRGRSIFLKNSFPRIRGIAAGFDGAFVIDPEGNVRSVAQKIIAPDTRKKLPEGYGARRTAAASITDACDCITIVVSQTDRSVILFHGGRPIIELFGGDPHATKVHVVPNIT